MALERTFVAIKPDGVQRQIMGEVISRFEKAGLKFVGMKMVHADKDFAKKHYAEHLEKPFYKLLENYITSGPVLGFVLEGIDAIETVRKLVGATAPSKSLPGTIRGDFAHMTYERGDTGKLGIVNIIHASANAQDAQKEIHLWFSDSELFEYETVHSKFM